MGGKAVKCYHHCKGKDAPAPALDLEWFFLYSIISAQIPHESPEPLCSFTVRFL